MKITCETVWDWDHIKRHLSSGVISILHTGWKAVPIYNPIQTLDADASNCRVELHRQCVWKSQVVGDSFDESEQICKQQVELHRVGSVNAPVGSRRELVANCVHTTINSSVASRRPCVLGISHGSLNKFCCSFQLFSIAHMWECVFSTMMTITNNNV